MKLTFFKEFRLLKITQCTHIELKQLNKTCTVSWIEWRGKTKKTMTKNYIHNSEWIPGGFWHKILKLREMGYDVTILNVGEFVNKKMDLESFTEWVLSLNTKYTRGGYAPYDYQIKGAWLATRYPISRGEFGTGAGKTYLLYLMIRYLQEFILQPSERILIVVPSIMLVNQSAADFNEYHLDGHFPVDTIYGGSTRNRDAQVCVGSVDSIMNYDSEFFKPVRALVFDEAHKDKTNGYQMIYKMLISQPLSFIYSCSGTFYNTNTHEDYQAASISGPVLINVGYHQLKELGAVSPVKIKMIKFQYSKSISEEYYNHPDSINSSKRSHFESKYIQSQIPRFLQICKIARSINHNQLLLFKTRQYLRVMRKYMERHFSDHHILEIHGDIGHQRREEIKEFTEKNENCIILATYPTMSTGVSIKNLSTIHLVDGAKSFIMVRQSIGRALRLHKNKKWATVLDYHDHFKRFVKDWPGRKRWNISVSHAKAREKIYIEQKMEFTKHTIQID